MQSLTSCITFGGNSCFLPEIYLFKFTLLFWTENDRMYPDHIHDVGGHWLSSHIRKFTFFSRSKPIERKSLLSLIRCWSPSSAEVFFGHIQAFPMPEISLRGLSLKVALVANHPLPTDFRRIDSVRPLRPLGNTQDLLCFVQGLSPPEYRSEQLPIAL